MRTMKERRDHYREMEGKMSQEEIMRAMPADELRMNAKKGGVDAIAELERREFEKARHIVPQSDIDIGV